MAIISIYYFRSILIDPKSLKSIFMRDSFLNRTNAVVLILILYFSMLVITVIARYIRRKQKTPVEEFKGTLSTLMASLFALFGLILAFTFNMSGTRYEAIKNIFIDESTTIGTAIRRADMYSDSVRQEMRRNFKNYLEGRITYYNNYFEAAEALSGKNKAEDAIHKIWDRVIQQSNLPHMEILSNNMISDLNHLIDVAEKRELLGRARVPDLMLYMLFILSCTMSFIIGYTTPTAHPKTWTIVISFITISCLIIYVSLDLSRPMRGFVKADYGYQAMAETLENFHLEQDK